MTKNSKYNMTIKLLGIVTATLLLFPIMAQTPVQLATAQGRPETEINSKYYLQQYIITHQQVLQLIEETSEMEKQVSDLKAENALGNEEKIRQLEEQIDRNKQKMQSLEAELNEIQEKSQALFRVDPATKQKLDDAQTVLYNKYMNKKSPTYVGNNPVQEITVDYEYKKLLVSFDPDETINNPVGDKSKAIISEMKNGAGDIPVDVEYYKMQEIICTTRYQQCDPLVAGTAIKASSATDPCTEGYKAFNWQGSAGFVMAGHCGSSGNAVHQPPPGYSGSRQVGTITQRAYDSSTNNCTIKTHDFSFVTTSVSTGTWIFNDGNNFWVMQNKIPGSQQQLGTVVIKSGIGSNVQYGTISAKHSNNSIRVTINWAGGDSGAPVFKSTSGSNVDMYGMAFCAGGSYTWYYPTDFIKNTFGLTG